MKVQLLCLLLVPAAVSVAQDKKQIDTSITIDLLRAPSSPGAILAGISPSEIQKPTDVTSFMVSLQQSTNNFSQLPKSYALDFAPGLSFNSRNLTVDHYTSNSFKDNFVQSFTISAAFRNLDAGEEDSLTSPATRLGLGFRFSILRGKLNTASYSLLKSLGAQQVKVLHGLVGDLDTLTRNDAIIQEAEIRMAELEDSGRKNSLDYATWQKIAVDREDELKSKAIESNKDELDRLTEMGRNLKIEKIGAKIDVAGGLVVDFLERTFNNSYVTKGGLWVTGGWETNSGWSFLGIGRYLFNPDKIFADENGLIRSANVSTFDFGGRVIFSSPVSRFSLSSEAIY
jgi:hypothetical protein